MKHSCSSILHMEDDREILLASDEDLELQSTANTAPKEEGVDADDTQGQNNEREEERPNRMDIRPLSKETVSSNPANIVYVAACVSAVGGLLFGYDMGVISGAKVPMQYDLKLSCLQVGSVVAFLPIGGFFASVVGGNFE